MIDVLVVGGGPAGLATALYAARAGLEAVVVEQRPGPVDKACGEGLMPGAVRALEELVGPLTGFPLQGIRYLDDGSRCAEATVQPRPGAGDAPYRPARRAGEGRRATRASSWSRDASASVTPGRVRGAGRRRPGPLPGGRRRPALRHPARRWGSPAPAPGRRATGCGGTSRCRPGRDLVEVTWSRRSEAYVTPVGARPGRRRRPHLRAGLVRRPPAGVPGAGRAAAAARRRRRCAGPVRCASARAGRWPGGCCWSATPPATSTRSPARASRWRWPAPASWWTACCGDRPQDYERAWRRASRSYRVLTGSLLWARRPAAARAGRGAGGRAAGRGSSASVVDRLAG